MLSRALTAVALAALLTGCTAIARQPAEAIDAAAQAEKPRAVVMDWSDGNWWAYHATIEDVTFDVAIVVHEGNGHGYRLGTNLSSGFFGLPWSGNVTPDRNPRIGGEEWTLFDFPLADGKEWSYSLLGYEAKTVARAATIALPDGMGRPGYHLESSAYGQVFASYDYVEEVGWFTRLALIEPTDGHTVLEARLTAFGNDWDEAYFVEETVAQHDIIYPAAPGALDIQIPSGYLQLSALLTAEAHPGLIDGRLRDDAGRLLASTRAVGMGGDAERASARAREDAVWTLEHAGVGAGAIRIEITGLSATGPLAERAAAPTVDVDLVALLQSTRPAYPQLGQTTSVELPIALGV